MPQQNFLIGIGGTGARCIEAFLHLTAAGLGGERIWIGLIDQDQSNGNVARTTELLTDMIELRRELRETAQHNLGNVSLFKPQIATAESGSFWCPLPGARQSLKEFFRYQLLSYDARCLFDSLYHVDEQTLQLDVGFRGRPSIGAAVIMAQSKGGDPFWRELVQAVKAAVTSGTEARLFVVGSIFGGTGAAGVPTLARLLRRLLEDERLERSARVGGLLVLPYFGFPPAHQDESAFAARADSFLEQTQGALRYYSRILADQQVFDHLYALGWSPLIDIRQSGGGGSGQVDPAMLPELYAGLAAAHFFSQPMVSYGDTSVLVAGRRPDSPLTWEDLPALGADRGLVRNRLGQLLRFAVAYRWVYRPALEAKTWRSCRHEAWFRRLIDRQGVPIDSDPTQMLLKHLDRYCDRLLRWIGEVSLWTGASEVRLFDARRFSERGDSAAQEGLVRLRGLTLRQSAEVFPELVVGGSGTTLADVLEGLTYNATQNSEKGLGAFLAELYRLSAVAATPLPADQVP